jgi:hypothetical protein
MDTDEWLRIRLRKPSLMGVTVRKAISRLEVE